MTPLVEMRGITKSFGETHALRGVDIELHPGEVHAIVGENGAGKSTLGRCLAGLYDRYDGTVTIAGRAERIVSPDQAKAAGVAMVHQELNLFPHLPAAENIFLGTEVGAMRFGLVNRRAQTRAAADALQRLGAHIDPRTPVAELSVANRQIVEIAKATASTPRVLILDEPTSSLSSTETEALFGIIRRLRDDGLAIAYISHRLEEIFSIADRVTVLRDGQRVRTLPVSELTPESLVRLMVGRGVSELYRPPTNPIGPALLTVKGLSLRGEYHDVSFTVHEGEILGLAGLIGAGRTQVAESIFGLRKPDHGVMAMDGQRVQIHSPTDAIRFGIYLVPEDRRGKGLIPLRSIRENTTLALLPRYCRRRWWSESG